MQQIPNNYKPASWRNTTPVDKTDNTIGVGFEMGDGSIIRLKLPIAAAKHLSESIHGLLYDHSETSSGIPSLDVSTPLDSEKV